MKTLSIAISHIFFLTNSLCAHTVESHVWAERRKGVQEKREVPLQLINLAALPLITSTDRLIEKPPSIPLWAGKIDPSPLAHLIRSLPNAYGTVRNVSVDTKRPSQKTVIHIQDVHMNREAQINISKTVQELINNKKVDLVALEGAFGPIDLTSFHTFPHQDTVQKVAEYLLKQNKIQGPLYIALTNPIQIPSLVGVDDFKHYTANVEAYKEASQLMKPYRKKLKRDAHRLNKEKQREFSSELLAFDRAVQAYEDGRLSLSDYIPVLTKSVSIESQAIQTLKKALQLERSLNFPQIESERSRLLDQLLTHLKEAETAELLNFSLAFRLGRIRHTDFYENLKELCRKNSIPLDRFPHIKAYLHYLLLSEQIELERLFKDIRRSEEQIYSSLAKTEQQKRLVAQSRHLYLTSKLIDFALTREEWEKYRTAFHEPWTIDQGLNLSSFERFYREAVARDQAIANNLIEEIKRSGANITILVTGGFHSYGISQRLQNAGLNIITFVPKITKVESATGATYLSVFTQEKTPLEKLFQGDKLFIPPVAWSQPQRVYTGILMVLRQFWLSLGKMMKQQVVQDLKLLTGIQLEPDDIQYEKGDVSLRIKNAMIGVRFKLEDGTIESDYQSLSHFGSLKLQMKRLGTAIQEWPRTMALVFSTKKAIEFIEDHRFKSLEQRIKQIISKEWLRLGTWMGFALGNASGLVVGLHFCLSGPTITGLAMLGAATLGTIANLLTHLIQIDLFPEAAMTIEKNQNSVLIADAILELNNFNHLATMSINDVFVDQQGFVWAKDGKKLSEQKLGSYIPNSVFKILRTSTLGGQEAVLFLPEIFEQLKGPQSFEAAELLYRTAEQLWLKAKPAVLLRDEPHENSELVQNKQLINQISQRTDTRDYNIPLQAAQAYALAEQALALLMKGSQGHDAEIHRLTKMAKYLNDNMIRGSVAAASQHHLKVYDHTAETAADRHINAVGLWHGATNVIPYAQVEGKTYLYIAKRSNEKFLFPGAWSFIGGKNGLRSDPLVVGIHELVEEGQLKEAGVEIPQDDEALKERFGSWFKPLGKGTYRVALRVQNGAVITEKQMTNALKMQQEITAQEAAFPIFDRIHFNVVLDPNDSLFGLIKIHLMSDRAASLERLTVITDHLLRLGIPIVNNVVARIQQTFFLVDVSPIAEQLGIKGKVAHFEAGKVTEGDEHIEVAGLKWVPVEHLFNIPEALWTDIVALALTEQEMRSSLQELAQPNAVGYYAGKLMGYSEKEAIALGWKTMWWEVAILIGLSMILVPILGLVMPLFMSLLVAFHSFVHAVLRALLEEHHGRGDPLSLFLLKATGLHLLIFFPYIAYFISLIGSASSSSLCLLSVILALGAVKFHHWWDAKQMEPEKTTSKSIALLAGRLAEYLHALENGKQVPLKPGQLKALVKQTAFIDMTKNIALNPPEPDSIESHLNRRAQKAMSAFQEAFLRRYRELTVRKPLPKMDTNQRIATFLRSQV